MVIAFFGSLALIFIYILAAGYTERKIAAFIQDRLGPMQAGPNGIFIMIADGLKLLQKEDITPVTASKKMYFFAPVVIFTAVFAGFAVVPLTSTVIGSQADVGVFYILAITTLDVLGILMAGWSANNKFTLYGATRSVAQIISYEVPLGLSALSVVMICQTLDLQEISYQQGIFITTFSDDKNYLFGLKQWGIDITQMGGFLSWNIVKMPLLSFGFIIFFISSLAESNRAPFDLPEAESELIGGFHTEFSGIRWALVMLAEYAMMLLVSFLAVILFLGSWNTPFINVGMFRLADWTSGTLGTLSGQLWSLFWILSKVFFLIFVQMFARWTYPRLRVDQLMTLSWKYLTPAALLLILCCGVWRLLMV
jgi:NADH-quinone oxidoreductase subunit H